MGRSAASGVAAMHAESGVRPGRKAASSCLITHRGEQALPHDPVCGAFHAGLEKKGRLLAQGALISFEVSSY